MLVDLGRNPHLPWQRQSDKITIDGDRDYISDRGDEVWNVLESRGIKNVILTGVHVNMCVLGRPFGLRQMARNGKNVVLMRDMTDSMYNPASWPYVSHYRGNDRIISHIERFVCPTITSDQFIGGKPFRFAGDSGESDDRADDGALAADRIPYRSHWTGIAVPIASSGSDTDLPDAADAPAWYRCVVFSPQSWQEQPFISLDLGDSFSGSKVSAFLNGQPLEPDRDGGLRLATEHLIANDHNLLVIRVEGPSIAATKTPVLKTVDGQTLLALQGKWQLRIGDDADWANMPLPAKFGGGADIVFTPEEPLWTARAVTRPGLFTAGIEGPACDRDGNIFAVSYERQGTIGRVAPDGWAEVFVELPAGSIGNGIRFDSQGFFYVADYTKHQVLKVDPTTRGVSVLAKNDSMNQPNDLAIADDGTLFASDPDWAASTGQIWRIDADGTTTLLAKDMGTTNGIEVSPDGKTLYVNESVQRNVWAFTINMDKTLADKRLVSKFEDFGFDGMRADVDGNLYITRHGKGTVIKMSPAGEILREIDVLGTKPSNLCFGGPDGRTVYVTEVDGGRLVSFRVDSPGQSWLRWRND
jgi:sugar lactone lactonase YvrE